MALFALSTVIILSLGALFLITGIRKSVSQYIFDEIRSVPEMPAAIVFGAAVWSDGQLSHVLADRVRTAADLYHAGTVQKLVMSGDNRFEWYNEPAAMRAYAQSLGVPQEAIVLDYAGRRTYDTCYRGLHIFGIERAVLVTQAYHQPRAVYTCRKIGMEAIGASSYSRPYAGERRFELREVPALLLAWWDTNIAHPEPVMGERIPIFAE